MRNFWAKLIFLAIVALAFSLPAWAVELKLSGHYEMQGRYYSESDIIHAKYYGAEAPIGSQLSTITATAAQAAYGSLIGLTDDPFGLDTGADGYLSAAEITAGAATIDAMLGAGTAAGLAALIGSDPLPYLDPTRYIETKVAAATVSDPMVPGTAITDTEDSDAYLKHYFYIDPKLIITDKISISANIVAYENKLDWDEYGRHDKAATDPRLEDEYDRYNIFRIDNLWADVLTKYGKFQFGKTADYLGIGYFTKIPDLDEWTFGLIWHKDDEDGGNWGKTTPTDSDDADSDAYILMAMYNTPSLSATGKFLYAHTGSDGGGGDKYAPTVNLTYKVDALTLKGFATYAWGEFAKKDCGSLKSSAATFSPLLALMGYDTTTFLPGGMFKDDWEYGGYSGYVEASYDLSDVADVNLTPILTLAYASGADEPTKLSGYFADDVDFGSWLMNDVSDRYNMYFETPVSDNFDALGDPSMDDYSFSNIMLVRLGGDLKLSDKLSLTGNVIWAQKANTDYLEEWNPELGIINAMNQDLTKIAVMGQYNDPTNTMKNDVDKGLGWEVNAKATYQVQDNFKVALQAAYYAPGDFYESAFEKAFGNTPTGLELEDHYAARWFATVTF